MKVITLLNEKGGVGKTTLATHIATYFALKGFRTLLIDADAQGNATSFLGLPNRPSLYNLVVRDGQPESEWRNVLDVVAPEVLGGDGQLYVVASNIETRLIQSAISDGMILRRRLQEIATVVDFVIFDSSPSPSLFHASILAATDYVVVPTQLESGSAIYGIANTLLHGSQTRQYIKDHTGIDAAQVIGIVPNMYRANTGAHEAMINNLRQQYGDVLWDAIPMSIVFAEAAMLRQTLFAYAPNHERTRDLMALGDKILETVGVR